jgi:NAD(P)H-hydrate epimerase
MPLPPRDKNARPEDFGKLLIIGGAAGHYAGPYFAATSFLKAGGGRSHLAAPRSVIPLLASKGSEIAFAAQEETSAGNLALRNKRALLELSERMDMVVLGPGLSLDPEAQQLTRELTREIGKPVLIDGDAITAMPQALSINPERETETILTAHVAEMSKLTGKSVQETEENKVDLLQRTARELNATIILKGARSLIGYADQRVSINVSGNPGMATAGSGSVLTGTIAAMFGLGLPLQDAVSQGVFIHGLAGDLAAEDKGEDGLTARDMLHTLPFAVRMARERLNEELEERYAGTHMV